MRSVDSERRSAASCTGRRRHRSAVQGRRLRFLRAVRSVFGCAPSRGSVSWKRSPTAGAKSFGYPTFWVNRANQPTEQLGVDPDGTSPSLDGLVEFVLPRAKGEGL